MRMKKGQYVAVVGGGRVTDDVGACVGPCVVVDDFAGRRLFAERMRASVASHLRVVQRRPVFHVFVVVVVDVVVVDVAVIQIGETLQ